MVKHVQFIEGKPVAKQRPRVTREGTYTPKATRDWEDYVGFTYTGPHFDGPVQVVLLFLLPDHRPRDLDNLCKSVLDGLNGIAWDDDKQVTLLHKRKCVSKRPGVYIGLCPGPCLDNERGALAWFRRLVS